MPDYKEMYLKMERAPERAISIPVTAQQDTEEIYISTPEADMRLLVNHEKGEVVVKF